MPAKPWTAIWSDVAAGVRDSRTRNEAVQRATALRGEPTTWDALARAWRRMTEAGQETGRADTALCVDFSGIDRQVDPVRLGDRVYRVGQTFTFDHVPGVGRKHLVVPDTQVKPGVPLDHFKWIGRYIADKGPDVVIHLGDHWDMPSLSTYDSAAKKAARGVAKVTDIEVGNHALELLEEELTKAGVKPTKILLEGNHDGFADQGRVGRYLADHPDDDGLIRPDQFADSWLGWKRVPFLEPIDIDGILYCHLFPFNQDGKVTPGALRMGASSAKVQCKAMAQSTTAGHRQGIDTSVHPLPTGRTLRGVIAGSCYLHDEAYMGPGNRHYRGILVKHDVRPSNPNHYDLMEVSLEFLRRKYGGN